jgi:hypothetical protein
MLGGSELIMTALAILLAVNLVRSPTPSRQAAGGREAYNGRLALLASGSPRRHGNQEIYVAARWPQAAPPWEQP